MSAIRVYMIAIDQAWGYKVPMKNTTHDTTMHFRINTELRDRLRVLSDRADVPMSALLRRLLKDALPRWEARLDEDRLALL